MADFRARIAKSRLAPVAAFPVRLATVARHDAHMAARSASWLWSSREHTNFTYDLTPRNREHLVWWVSAVTGSPAAPVRDYVEELHQDEDLRRHLLRTTASSERRGLADLSVRYGRRAGWYAIARILRPAVVVETGTDKGLGSCVFAAALLRNGCGRLTTVDVNPESGYLISGKYADVVDRVIGDSRRTLQMLDTPVDLFLHDSLHTFEHETAELDAVRPRLTDQSILLSDNAHGSDALLTFAKGAGRSFLYFQEVPENHWYPGDGIGAAWVPG
jgi:predicted O-methyltransferase YrrM